MVDNDSNLIDLWISGDADLDLERDRHRLAPPAAALVAEIQACDPSSPIPEARAAGLLDAIDQPALGEVDRAGCLALLYMSTNRDQWADGGAEIRRRLRHACLGSDHPLVSLLPDIVFVGFPARNSVTRRLGFRRHLSWLQFGWHLCLNGIGQPLLDLLSDDPAIEAQQTLENMAFVNAVACGNLGPAVAHGEDMRLAGRPHRSRTMLTGSLNCLWIEQLVLGGLHLDPHLIRQRLLPAGSGVFEQDIHDLAACTFADPDHLRGIANRPHGDALLVSSNSLIAYNPVRVALQLGDLDTAAKGLERRSHAGRSIWLDHLFWMRIHVADGDDLLARDHAERALQGAERYRAHGRLEFELRLSRELALVDLLRWADRSAATAPPLPVAATGSVDGLIGDSPSMRRVREQIAAYAPTDQAVLIRGETGTGKDLIARTLHSSGPRRDQPFVAINCAAVHDSLLEAELFGHVKGAYTGAAGGRPGLIATAGEGTLFLDEIGDTNPRFQTVLLRLLENGEYRPIGSDRVHHMRCRILAATNADLEAACATGGFREDLLYRLQQLFITVPPLRERPEDLDDLVAHFLARHDRRLQADDKLLETLRNQPWKGNVRELRNTIDRLVIHHPTRLSFSVADFLSLPDLQQRRPIGSLPPFAEDVEPSPEPTAPATVPTPARAPAQRPAGLGIGNPQMALRERILAVFREHHTLTRKHLIELLGLAPATATRYLKQLCADGRIERIEPNRARRSHYFRWIDASED